MLLDYMQFLPFHLVDASCENQNSKNLLTLPPSIAFSGFMHSSLTERVDETRLVSANGMFFWKHYQIPQIKDIRKVLNLLNCYTIPYVHCAKSAGFTVCRAAFSLSRK